MLLVPNYPYGFFVPPPVNALSVNYKQMAVRRPLFSYFLLVSAPCTILIPMRSPFLFAFILSALLRCLAIVYDQFVPPLTFSVSRGGADQTDFRSLLIQRYFMVERGGTV